MLSSFLSVKEFIIEKLWDTLQREAGADGNPRRRGSLFIVRLFQFLVDIPQLDDEGLTALHHSITI